MEPRSKTDIIVAAHNAGGTIDATLRSVIDQTDPNWRLWIVDDGSTDDTFHRVGRYLYDPRIQIFPQDCSGPSAARNHGLERSGFSGEFVAFLDADDIWHATFLEETRAVLEENPSVGLVWTEMNCFEGATGTYRADREPVVGEAVETLPRIFSQVTFLGSAVLTRSKFFREGLRYPEEFRTMEDVHVWSAIAAQSKIATIPAGLVDYRVRATSLSNAPGSMLKNYGDNVRSYRALYRNYAEQIPRAQYRERMIRAHRYAGEDRMRLGHTGWLCTLRALAHAPKARELWKLLALGLRSKVKHCFTRAEFPGARRIASKS